MKLKVTEVAFYDKVEQEYVFKDKTPIIEREEERGRQLIKAGVCEELIEPEEELEILFENPSEEAPSEPEPEREKKKPKSWLKK